MALGLNVGLTVPVAEMKGEGLDVAVELGVDVHGGVAVKVDVSTGITRVGNGVAVAVFLRWYDGLRGSFGLVRPCGLSNQNKYTSAWLGAANANTSMPIARRYFRVNFMVRSKVPLACVMELNP